ncbi:AsmA family protein [Aquamicrobium sp. cd-1]|uniref:AsmA family protein n=1 Tax=Aquamicrobium zhengzhouense TaxID=2781738 RepID=A0ABS0SEE8_9HYPH|nr:AsmA family protein [Aquamicrobium zhengzhouense]
MLTIRKGLIALAALLLLALLFVTVLPWIASTKIVRDRIAYELSLWSGYRVSLGEAPELNVWPTFSAALRDVSFHEWAKESPAVLEADRLDVSLSPLAALRGRVEMSSISMYRPLLRLNRTDVGLDLPASPGGGRMMQAINTATRLVQENPKTPDLKALPSDAFGNVEFVDGKIVIVEGDETEGFSNLTGKITWPALNRTLRINANGVWRGEAVQLEASAENPLILMGGGNATVMGSLKSPLSEASFNGTANFSGERFFDGEANMATPALRRMLEWLRVPVTPGSTIGPVSVSSRIQGSGKRLRLDNASLKLGSNNGTGGIDIAFVDEFPAISGTLAFDTLDLRTYLAGFTSIASGSGSLYAPLDTGIANQISLDLRLSATTATLGHVTLSEIAASTQVKGPLMVLDLSHADGFGGELQAGLRIDTIDDRKAVEIRLIATEVEALALAKAAGAERLLPQGRANISVMLKGSGNNWNDVLGSAEGSVAATIGPGSLGGLDLAKFRERWGGGGFFALSEVAGGPIALSGGTFNAKVTGGVARIEKADLLLEDQRIFSFSGIIPYFGRALAVSGHLVPVLPGGTRGLAEYPFFIGGAWDTPYVAPVVPSFENQITYPR